MSSLPMAVLPLVIQQSWSDTCRRRLLSPWQYYLWLYSSLDQTLWLYCRRCFLSPWQSYHWLYSSLDQTPAGDVFSPHGSLTTGYTVVLIRHLQTMFSLPMAVLPLVIQQSWSDTCRRRLLSPWLSYHWLYSSLDQTPADDVFSPHGCLTTGYTAVLIRHLQETSSLPMTVLPLVIQ